MDSLAAWALWLVRVMLGAGVVFNLWYGCRKASAIRRRRAILRRVRQRASLADGLTFTRSTRPTPVEVYHPPAHRWRVPVRPSDTPI